MSSFMKETRRDRYFAALEAELAQLLDPETGMLSERFARHVACPSCRGDEPQRLFVKRGYTFVRCAACDLVYANPQVSEQLVQEEYRHAASVDLWVDVLTSERQLELDTEKFEAILDELEPYRGSGRLLDIGTSIGLFLKLAQDRGWDATGTEFNERALRYAREEFGLDVRDRPLADAGFDAASFDVVTLNSVLEHVNEPRTILSEVAELLKPSGAVYVIVPNVESLACRVLHEQAMTFDGRNHLVYFSPRTLRNVLERCGYGVESTRTRVQSLEPVLEWLTYNEPYSGADLDDDPLAATLESPARSAAVAQLFDELQLGYKLHCLARRRG